MRYRTSSADTPRPASPTYRIVSKNCPPTQITPPTAGRIRIYRARRSSTADMPVRLHSGSRCRDTLGLSITDDDDDEDNGSMYRFDEQSPRMLFGSRYCDRMY